jgi:hypothetical protein
MNHTEPPLHDEFEEEVESIRARLNGYTTPPPPDARAMIARLQPLVEARQAGSRRTVRTGAMLRHWLLLVRAELLLIEPSFWVATAIIFLIGIGVGLASTSDTLPILFTLSAPLLGAASVVVLFRPTSAGLRELERISPTHPLELLYARLLPILCWNGLITLVLLALSAARTPELVWWRLLVVWVGPMLALTMLALYSTIRWGAIAGVAIPLVCWVGVILLAENVRWWWRQASGSNGMLAISIMALLFGVLLLFETQRVFVRQARGER